MPHFYYLLGLLNSCKENFKKIVDNSTETEFFPYVCITVLIR